MTLGLGILLYELLCDDDQLMSVIVDDWMLTHPNLTRMVTLSVALHLINAIPERLDMVSQGFWLWRYLAKAARGQR
jgi:hypothetical protein